ncbi:MAG: phage holin family protein [Leeuwenhoekiella sp.]
MSIFNIKENVGTISDDFRAYLESTKEYYKLTLLKKSAKSTVNAIYFFLVGLLFLILLMFASVGVAIDLGDALGNPGVGFYIVAGFYFILLLIVLAVARKVLTKVIIKAFSNKMYKEAPQENTAVATEHTEPTIENASTL